MTEPDKSGARSSLWNTAGIAVLVYVLFYVLSTFLLPRLGADAATASTGLPESLDLTQMIRQVKLEVSEATRMMIEGGEPAMFQVEGLELEVQFVIAKKAGSGIAELVPISVNSEVSSEKVQRIRLTMKALPQEDFEGTQGVISGEPTVVIPN